MLWAPAEDLICGGDLLNCRFYSANADSINPFLFYLFINYYYY